MLEKTLAAVAGLVALATAILVAVVATAFALFFVLAGPVGPAGAAAIVAGLFALIVGLLLAVVAGRSHQQEREHEAEGGFDLGGLAQRAMEMAKQKPLLTTGAAIAAALIAIRNPALVATIVAAFIDKPRK